MVWNDDLRSSLSMIWFKAESNNPLHFPPTLCVSSPSLSLAEKKGFGHYLSWKFAQSPLSTAVSVSEFWRLITAESPHCHCTVWGSIPGLVLIAAIMNLSDHGLRNPLSVLLLFNLYPVFYPCLSVQHYVSTLEYVCNVGWDIVAQECARERRQLLASHSCNW